MPPDLTTRSIKNTSWGLVGPIGQTHCVLKYVFIKTQRTGKTPQTKENRIMQKLLCCLQGTEPRKPKYKRQRPRHLSLQPPPPSPGISSCFPHRPRGPQPQQPLPPSLCSRTLTAVVAAAVTSHSSVPPRSARLFPPSLYSSPAAPSGYLYNFAPLCEL